MADACWLERSEKTEHYKSVKDKLNRNISYFEIIFKKLLTIREIAYKIKWNSEIDTKKSEGSVVYEI